MLGKTYQGGISHPRQTGDPLPRRGRLLALIVEKVWMLGKTAHCDSDIVVHYTKVNIA